MKQVSVSYRLQDQTLVFRTALALMLIIFGFETVSNAQVETVQDIEPPPLVILSEGEKNQLQSETDVKDRTRLAIELMEARIAKSENFCDQKLFRECLDELGRFQAIVTDALAYLNRNNTGKRKVQYNFKRLDINLRGLLPRLEILRRKMPYRFAFHVRNLMQYVSKTREKATDAQFAETVLPNNDAN